MIAHIYSPSKTVTQSGQKRENCWLLRYERQSPQMIEPLMGYTSSADMQTEVTVRFNSKEEAVAFAEKNGISYYISEPHKANVQKKSYSDNFRADRKQPWTH